MIELKDLLSRFNQVLLSKEGNKESIRSIISETIKVKINSEDIQIKNGTIYLNIKPIYKNEIFLKQDKIISKLKEVLGEKIPKEIR